MEILNLKFELTEKEEMIDDLCSERVENSKEIYKMRLMLAEAWNLNLATDAEKVREVSRLLYNEEGKLFDGTTKNTNSGPHITEPININSSNLKNTTVTGTDSGIDVQSLEKLIDEKVAATRQET